ncbi:hypothetical protein MCUN1_003355 [Malassezia cuniculi]|uniref:PWWP domain-containing protein n=1 Tax=Malassezia cuniculi TaxID=948313 RepID=A0AAF0EY95_9BASI|nr:hypothetical protein MCUN1_003355 [Malassezia cuniculi]
MSTEQEFKVGDVVLAKIKGFPAWPGIIMDDENVPSDVLEERPSSKNRQLYTVRFFPAADYNWATARDMQRLTEADINEFLEKTAKKTSDLYKAYQIARDPVAWNEEKNKIVKEHEEWLANGGADEEEEAEEEEEEEEEPRKRKAPAAGASRKKAKAPEPEEKAEPEIELDPATKRVREWRHKLQRAFLNKEGVIVASELETHDATFKTVEAYDEMTADQLKATKIGKVMKRINQLAEIPRDDEFKFRERAGALVLRWGAILGKGEEHEGDETREDAREESKDDAKDEAKGAESTNA